jgi:hypothetical protein
MSIPVLTCEFVESSEVFRDCPSAMEVFSECDPDCSWGNNNRTMVTPDVIINTLDGAYIDEDEAELQKEIDTVLARLRELPHTMYVDLEN